MRPKEAETSLYSIGLMIVKFLIEHSLAVESYCAWLMCHRAMALHVMDRRNHSQETLDLL